MLDDGARLEARRMEPDGRGTAEAADADSGIDEAGRESFPASDPPAWTPVHPGAPAPHEPARDA